MIHRPTYALLSIGLLSLAFCIGCDQRDKKAQDGVILDYLGNGGGAGIEWSEIPSKGWGKLVGRVVYDGDPAEFQSIDEATLSKKDKQVCLDPKASKIELIRQAWIVDPDNKGVANFLVYIEAPPYKYFKIREEDKNRSDVVNLDQPHCNYVPHVFSLFPEYIDNKQGNAKRTGQVFQIRNLAPIAHNVNFAGLPKYGNGRMNISQGAGKVDVINSSTEVRLHPQPTPIVFACDIHPWMRAYGWVFNHPYHSVSLGGRLEDKSEDWGKFQIEHVPAGVKVRLKVWHPSQAFDIVESSVAGLDPNNGVEIQFEEGKTTVLNIKVRRR